MQMLLALLSQLLSYSLFVWIIFVAAAFCAARFGGLLGMVAGHVVIAVIVSAIDVRWVTAAMHEPGWDGAPDLDAVFMAGLVLRIFLINILLLPVTVAALNTWRRHHAFGPVCEDRRKTGSM
jgi:hypothetical protein